MIRIVHTADWHADSDPVKLNKLISSLDELLNYVLNNDVDVLLIAGDIWERKQTYSQKSGVPVILDKLKELCTHVKQTLIIKGNNAHDEIGSVELINKIGSKKLFASEKMEVLGLNISSLVNKYNLLDITEAVEAEDFNLIVSMIPYPTKSNFITNESIDNNNSDFIQKFEEIFEGIGDVTAPYNCPKILMFHGNVVGSRLSSGQSLVSQDIMVAPRTLQKANADYYALGHIHLRQEVAPNMVYSGSMYNKNWGETEPKSFEVIEFEESGLMKTERVYFQNANPMVTLYAEFKNGEFSFQDDLETIETAKQHNSEVRIKYSVAESERNLVTIERIAELKLLFGENVKIEELVIPDVRESRSEQIMEAKSLFEEVIEFARIIGQELPETIKSKVESIEEHKQ